MTDKPECIRCGGVLEQPEEGAQYECDDCGAVVAPGTVQEPRRRPWDNE